MKRLAEQTLYEILEIPQDASSPAIEAAVERARALYGPGSLVTYTLMSPDEAALLGSRIDEARRVLLDPDERSRYDASLASCEGELRAAVSATNGVAAAGGNGIAAGANGIATAGANGAPPASGSAGPNGAAPPIFAPIPVIPAVQPQAETRSVPASPAPPAAPPEEARDEAPPRIALREPVASPSPVPARAPIRLDREIHAPVAPPAAATLPPPAPPAAAPEPEDVPMPEGAAWTGDALRRVREARGITVQQIADRTKVTRHHVENIEAERFTALPAPVYLRGILLAMARELRLDGQKVARAYLDRAAAAVQVGKR